MVIALAVSASGCATAYPAAALAALASMSGGGGSGSGDLDVHGPEISLSSPARGSILTGDNHVVIRGRVEDLGSGLASFTLNGETFMLSSGGSAVAIRHAFAVRVALRFGINVIQAEAADLAGNMSSAAWAYLWSPSYLSLNAAIEDGIAARVTASALDRLPPQVRASLTGKGTTRTDRYGRLALAVATRPTLVIDDANAFAAFADAIVSDAGDSPPQAQLQEPPAVLPVFPARGVPSREDLLAKSRRDVRLAIRTDVINQALASWHHAGRWRIRVDAAAVAAEGLTLPFALDASLLLPFFPALEAIVPNPQAMPLVLDIMPLLPPVVDGGGHSRALRASVGEVHVTLSVDAGGQPWPVLSFATHFDLRAVVEPGDCGPVLRFRESSNAIASLLSNPLGLPPPDVESFLRIPVPAVISLAGGMIPPVPIPWLQCLKLPKVDVRQDGAGGEFITIEGDVP